MKILVIKPSSLGDIIHGLQVMESLRCQLPQAQIDWVAREVFAPLVQACDTVDKTYIFYRQGGLGAFRTLIKQLRQVEYDWVLDLQGLLRSGLLTWCSRGRRKAGRADAREGARYLYAQRVAAPSGCHAVEVLMQFLELFGLAKDDLQGHLTFSSVASEELLPKQFPPQPIVFFADSRRPEKEWPGFLALTQWCAEHLPERALVWAGSKAALAEVSVDSPHFINLVGKTSLSSLPNLLAQACVVVSNDSGPMHLAAAMDKPLLALFGPTPPELYGPYPLCKKHFAVCQSQKKDWSDLPVPSVGEQLRKLLKQVS